MDVNFVIPSVLNLVIPSDNSFIPVSILSRPLYSSFKELVMVLVDSLTTPVLTWLAVDLATFSATVVAVFLEMDTDRLSETVLAVCSFMYSAVLLLELVRLFGLLKYFYHYLF